MKIKRSELEDFLGELYVLTEKSEVSRRLVEVTRAELKQRLQKFYRTYIGETKKKVAAINDSLRVLDDLKEESVVAHNDLIRLAAMIREIYVNINQIEAAFKDVFEF